jgi:uncharacterized protein YprB with RNaseH-like and TPR domain
LLETPRGLAYRIETRYQADHMHGTSRLRDLLALDRAPLSEIVPNPGSGDMSIQDLVFVDTETTGLAGGAGTLVFLIGVGTFIEDEFHLRQYFLRDPAEEPGMLSGLEQDLKAAAGFVTFNGGAFDIPLLEMRYMLGLRRRWPLTEWPNLDLLFPARRLWGRKLPDCTLGTLENAILGLRRTEQDVPGWQIPRLYLEFLRTGDAEPMNRVLYHNAIDVLSLVTLATEVLSRYQEASLQTLTDWEALAIARWHQQAGRAAEADLAYQQSLSGAEGDLRLEALRRYTVYLKRHGRHQEALQGWQSWHALAPQDPAPCIELAKYYEWKARDLGLAHQWADRALACLDHWPNDWRKDQAREAIEHRLARLARKRRNKL